MSQQQAGSVPATFARALDALYRPRQAQALWKRLAFDMGVAADSEQRKRARAALA